MRALRLAAILLFAPFAAAHAQMVITIAPPVLFVVAQPPLPAVGMIGTPGYWANGGDGYYWVAGAWVMPPAPGLYWTPGYWGAVGGSYLFHAGYWGPQVGYYGGINYGYGYGGIGYQGGEWRGRDFSYNRAANNFGAVHVTNIYERPIGVGGSGGRPSFNGPGGATGRANVQQDQAGRAGRLGPTAQQTRNAQSAERDPGLRATVNHGRPDIAAAGRSGPVNGGAPERAGGPLHQGSAARPAIAPHETAPPHPMTRQRDVPPAHQPAPQREVLPTRQAEPQRQAPAQRQAAPQRDAAPRPQARDAPRQEERH